MTKDTTVYLAVEDDLSEQLLRAILGQTREDLAVGAVYGKQGSGYLKRNVRAFNRSAAGAIYVMLTDLDNKECAPLLIADWFGCAMTEYARRRHRNMIFRVAVREAEAWLMADRERFAEFLGIRVSAVPHNLDDVGDPKKLLLELAKKSRSGDLRNDIVPRPGDKRIVGPDYGGRLSAFLASTWRVDFAKRHSQSLLKAAAAIQELGRRPF